MTAEYYCDECGHKLAKDERPCPNCGSSKRKITLELKEVVKLSVLPVNYFFRERAHIVLMVDKNGMSISPTYDYKIIIKM